MTNMIRFNEAEQLGFHFKVPGCAAPHAWYDKKTGNVVIAQDANLVTIPNTGVPGELTGFVDTRVMDVLTRPRKATEIFNLVQKGDWTTSHAKFPVRELTGSTQPYTDYGQSRTSGVNYNWLNRQQYIFQTVIQYGDLEVAMTAAARMQLAADKQAAAAYVIDVDSNLFYLFGVAGMEIYGILNQPGLTPDIAPLPSGTGASPLWVNKGTRQIYEDILELFKVLVSQTDGWIDQTSSITLLVSPATAVNLGKATDFNISVQDMLNKYFSNLRIVTIPELANEASGERIVMIAGEMGGNSVGELAYSDRVRAGRIIPDLSSFSQKWVSTTYGAIVYYPYGIATMRGIANNTP